MQKQISGTRSSANDAQAMLHERLPTYRKEASGIIFRSANGCRPSEIEIRTGEVFLPRGVPLVNAPRLCISSDCRCHRNKRALDNVQAVTDSSVDSKE